MALTRPHCSNAITLPAWAAPKTLHSTLCFWSPMPAWTRSLCEQQRHYAGVCRQREHTKPLSIGSWFFSRVFVLKAPTPTPSRML